MFDLDSLKDKLDSATLTQLRSHIEDLTGSRDAAKSESINGRKALKAELETLKVVSAKAFEKLGIDSADELDAIPEAKGQGDALKQFEAKLKRAERERDESIKARDALTSEMTATKRAQAIAQAVASGGFHDTEAAELLLSRGIEAQDDGYVFKTKEGRFIPLADGAKLIATERPHLVKAPTGTGSGHRDAGANAAAGRKTMSRAEFEGMPPSQKMELSKAGVALTA